MSCFRWSLFSFLGCFLVLSSFGVQADSSAQIAHVQKQVQALSDSINPKLSQLEGKINGTIGAQNKSNQQALSGLQAQLKGGLANLQTTVQKRLDSVHQQLVQLQGSVNGKIASIQKEIIELQSKGS